MNRMNPVSQRIKEKVKKRNPTVIRTAITKKKEAASKEEEVEKKEDKKKP
jgi:hypothetical protein